MVGRVHEKEDISVPSPVHTEKVLRKSESSCYTAFPEEGVPPTEAVYPLISGIANTCSTEESLSQEGGH